MKRLLPAVVWVVCLSPVARAADEENPFKKAKVGDWAEYKITTKANGANIEAVMKMTVTAKTDKEATLKTTSFANGKESAGRESKIDLTKPYDPTSTAGLPKGSEAKVVKDGEGKEKITVGGKEYDCAWMKMKVTTKINDKDYESTVKVWMSKEIPLSGMVKLDMVAKFGLVTMELTKTGSGGK